MEKIYIVSGGKVKVYLSSLEKAVKFIVKRYNKALKTYDYYRSIFPDVKSFVHDVGYNMFEVSLDIEEKPQRVDKDRIDEILDRL